FNIGYMYDSGHGVPQDLAEAARLYRLAADLGEPRAQYNLGLMYHDGDGVAQSDREALYWLTVAQRNADGGDPELAEALERNLVTSPLVTPPPSEHQAVVRSAQSWQPVAFTGFGTGDSYEDAIDAYD